MTDAEWRTTTDVQRMLLSLRKRQKRTGSDPERFRVFALASLRRMWSFFGDDLKPLFGELNRCSPARSGILLPLQALVEATQRQAVAALAAYHDGRAEAKTVGDRFAETQAAEAVWVTAVAGPFGGARSSASHAIHVAGWAEIAESPPPDFWDRTTTEVLVRLPESVAERAAQADLIRCIFGNPFRPVAFDPGWRTEAVVGLARGMDESRDYAALPVLADALEDAGCADAELLAHCRGPGPHARGCHALDHALGRW